MERYKTLSDKMSGRIRGPGDAGGKRILKGRLLRAPVSGGRIESMELPELPRGMVIISAKDSTANVKIGSASIPLFTDKEIHWKGEPILAAAANDIDEVDEWLSRIQLDISELENPFEPAVFEKLIEKGSTVEAFSKAFQVIEEKVDIPAAPAPGELETLVCVKDGVNYTIHAATSWPSVIKRNVADILKTDKKNIQVKNYPDNSLSKNRRMWYPALTACRAALLSFNAKKSVKICSLPDETAHYSPGTPGAEFHIRGAVDSDGRIIATEVIFTIHAGAYFPLEEEFFERVVLGLFSIYPCRNYSVLGRIIHEAAPPSTMGPAAGFELGFLAGELFASSVAEHSLASPGTWHRESFPVPGQAFGPGILLPKVFPMQNLLNRALDSSDFERKRASYEQTRHGKKQLGTIPDFYRGIGLSCAWFGNGFLSAPKELGSAYLSMTLDKEGGLLIDIPSLNHGSVLERAWQKLSADLLGIEDKNISFTNSDSRTKYESGPSVLGRNVSIYTKLLELAGNDLSKRRFRDPLPISVTRSKRLSRKRSWNSDLLEGSPFETISWGVGIVEVSVSTITMEITQSRIWLVIDGGVLLMPDFAKAAVESSAEGALKWCHPGNEYKELPMIDIQFHENSSRRQSKDVSTLPWLLIPSAFIQAVRQASGVAVNELPILPEQLRTGVEN